MPQTVSQALSLNVAAVAPLTITTTSLPDATEFESYSQQLTLSGGTAPYAWSLQSGALPAGISLSTSGLLSGTPSVSGPFSFTVQVTDSGA